MRLVRIIQNEDGEMQESKNDWHLVQNIGDSPRVVCTGEVFGEGEGMAVFKEKITGKITCCNCIKIVKWYKSIKL